MTPETGRTPSKSLHCKGFSQDDAAQYSASRRCSLVAAAGRYLILQQFVKKFASDDSTLIQHAGLVPNPLPELRTGQVDCISAGTRVEYLENIPPYSLPCDSASRHLDQVGNLDRLPAPLSEQLIAYAVTVHTDASPTPDADSMA
jgi:hypothetical protein